MITGAGPAFCAGADLKNPPGSATEGRKAVGLPDILQTMMNGDKPVIAAVNGAAFAGGLGLVGAADIVITVDDAPFSFSEVRIGVIPAIIARRLRETKCIDSPPPACLYQLPSVNGSTSSQRSEAW